MVVKFRNTTFAPLHRSSPFIRKLSCQAIQMEHSPYIAERTHNAVYIYCEMSVARPHNKDEEFHLKITGTYHTLRHCPKYIGMLEMHQISGRIIRPFLISCIRPDTKLPCRISGKAGYRMSGRISGYCLADPIIYLIFLHIRQKKFTHKLI
jgi:hypothetical protein